MSRPETVAERFAKDTAEHVLTVVHEDGVHRHLVARNPDRSQYWFEVVTWPGNLAVTGDMGTFVFRRLTDMLEFFAGGSINPSYWSEKLTASSDPAATFSPAEFRLRVTQYWRDHVEDDSATPWARELWAEIESEVLADSDGYDVAEAHAVLSRFSHDGFQFVDTWEDDYTDWSFRFLWICHAIRWVATTHRPVVDTRPAPAEQPAATAHGSVVTAEPQEQYL